MRTLVKSVITFFLLVGFVATFLVVDFITADAKTPTTSTGNVCQTWVHLVDVSSNNPHPINFSLAAKAGLAGVYVKATEGTWYANPYFGTDTKQAVKNGLPYGAYDFARPTDNAIADAKFFVKSGGTAGQLSPALDLETYGKTVASTEKWAIAWLDEVYLLTGKVPILYTGSFYKWSADISLGKWSLWLAAYPHGYQPTQSACGLKLPVVSAPWAKQGWTIWQFTSRGLIKGIGGYVDADVASPIWWANVTGAGVLPPSKHHNPIPVPIYAPGAHGVTVIYIQKILVKEHLLRPKQVTGYYDITTKHAVERYQSLMGVYPDGLWSYATVQANAWYQKFQQPVQTLANYPMMRIGTAFHTQVRWLQSKLNWAGYHNPVDGIFATRTNKSLISFQKSHHIAKVWWGITDLSTYRALWNVQPHKK